MKGVIIFSAACAFLIGFAIACSTALWNREGPKRGFRTGKMRGEGKRIDKQIGEGIKEESRMKFPSDEETHHASEAFVCDSEGNKKRENT